MHLDPPVTINPAGNQRLFGVGRGFLVVFVVFHLGFKHSVRLPVTIVPGLGRHLFAAGTAAGKGVNLVIAKSSVDTVAAKGVNKVVEKRSYLYLGDVSVPLGIDDPCCTL